VHVAAYVEELQGELSAPSVKQHLAGPRMLFDWLVVGGAMEVNPAHAVRGPKYSSRKGKTPVLDREEARALLESIDTGTLTGLRDRCSSARWSTPSPASARCEDERARLLHAGAARPDAVP